MEDLLGLLIILLAVVCVFFVGTSYGVYQAKNAYNQQYCIAACGPSASSQAALDGVFSCSCTTQVK